MGLDDTSIPLGIQRRRRIQGKASKHEIDLSLEKETSLWLAECKYHCTGPCQTVEVREFWNKCYDIQQVNINKKIHGFFFTSTFYEKSAIDWVKTHFISNDYGERLVLYTGKQAIAQPYTILLENLTRNEITTVTIFTNELTQVAEADLTFDQMVSISLLDMKNNGLSLGTKDILTLKKSMSSIEMLTNALLHKNYIDECIAMAHPIYANRHLLIHEFRNSTELAGILEIMGAYISAKMKRYRLCYKKHLSHHSLKEILQLIDEFAPQRRIPNGIATLARVCMPSLAAASANDKVRSLFDIAARSVDASTRADSGYLSRINQLSLAKANIVFGNMSSVEKNLLDFNDAIKDFPSARHKIAGRQSFLQSLIEYYKAIGDKKLLYDASSLLSILQIEQSLGPPK